MNSQNKKINISELSKILSDNSFFDDYLIYREYDFGNFETDDSNPNVGSIKKIYDINGKPFFKLNDTYVKCNSIHFQGHRKLLMEDIYKKFIN